MTIIKYGLKHKKYGLLGFEVFSNEVVNAEFCNDVSYFLTWGNEHEPLWMVDTKETAKAVKEKSSTLDSTYYEHPMHSFSSEDLEIIKYEINVDQGD